MPFPIITLSLVALGAGIVYGSSQYRKMKKKLPEDREIVPGTKQPKKTMADTLT